MTTQTSPIIEVRKLVKVYSKKNRLPIKALDGVDVEIHSGEFLAIVGRSGSGKSTFLNLVGALDRPTSGDVIFEGKNLKNIRDSDLTLFRRDKIGFVFQTFNLLPSLTIAENIEVAMTHSNISKEETKKRITALLKFVDLSDKHDRLPLELSVGQQQKAAIARAIVREPIVILADEPTGEMDPISGKEIVEKLIELNKKSKVTLIVASHGSFSYNEADRTLFIKEGKIVSQNEAGY
jgi:putative ABC transport system ATP-binding protein